MRLHAKVLHRVERVRGLRGPAQEVHAAAGDQHGGSKEHPPQRSCQGLLTNSAPVSLD